MKTIAVLGDHGSEIEATQGGLKFPWDDSRAYVCFNLGRILISRVILKHLSHEHIAYYVDMHRRGKSDVCSVAWDEHVDWMIQDGLSVASVFFTKGYDVPDEDVVYVLTNKPRTRTVVRFEHETSKYRNRERAKRAGHSLPKPWEPNHKDYFCR